MSNLILMLPVKGQKVKGIGPSTLEEGVRDRERGSAPVSSPYLLLLIFPKIQFFPTIYSLIPTYSKKIRHNEDKTANQPQKISSNL